MSTTLEMLIRAKYISQGAGTLESELKQIKKVVTELRGSSLTVNIDKFLPQPGDVAALNQELTAVTNRMKELQMASAAAFAGGDKLFGAAIQDEIKLLQQYEKALNSAISGVQSQQQFNVADFILSDTDVSALTARVETIKSQILDLKQATAKADLMGDQSGAGTSFDKRIKELEQYRRKYEDIIKTVESSRNIKVSDFILSPQDAAGISARLKQLQTELRQTRDALTKATMVGDNTAAKQFEKEIRDIQASIRRLRESELSQEKPDIANFVIGENDVAVVRSRVAAMEEQINRLKAAARAAEVANNQGARDSFLETAAGIEQQKKSLEGLIPVVEKTGFSIESLLTNRLTRLGFGIFALQSSFRTFTTIVSGFFDTLLAGASSLDRSRSFEILASGAGLNPDQLAGKLQVASQGLVKLDEAMARTIQLTKAGFPEIAANSDQLLKIATNAAIVSGDISQVTVVYDKLIRGIIRGSPRLIDDADIILKLGDANEAYAASLGKTVEELTAAEKVQATYNAVLQEGERINKLADQVDSTAVKVAKMKTEWREFTEILQESLAIILISNEELENSVNLAARSVESYRDLSTGDFMSMLGDMLTSLKGWGVILSGTLLLVKEGLSDVVERVKFFAQSFPLAFQIASKAVQTLGISFEYAVQKMTGMTALAEINAKRIASLTSEMNSLNDALGVILNTPFNKIDTGFGTAFDQKFNEILEAAGFIQGKQRTGTPVDIGGGAAAVDATEKTTEDLQKLLRERARMAEDIEYERVNKIRELNRDHADKMKDIARKLADALADIDRDLAQKLADLAQDRADKLADIAQDLADKISDIDQDLADKLSDIQQDANDKRADAQEEYNQGLVDAEEEYQKKIRDIMRKYEASRLSALIDRDARALFEAQKQRDEDLEDAADTAEEKRKQELEELEQKLKDINEAEERQRQDAIRNAEQRRRDAQQAAERQRRDALQAYERARRDAQQDAERRRRDARANAAQERRDALEDQARAREDLRQWYMDKLRDLQRYHQDELQEYANHYSDINELTGSFMDTQITAWNDFQEVIRGNREWIGIGSPTDPTTGEAWPDWRNPANVYPGGRCNRGSSQITTGADGRQYICVGNQWQLFNGVQPSGASMGASFAGASGGGQASGFASSGQRMKVVLEGDGSDALEKIIKSGAYSAFIEIVG